MTQTQLLWELTRNVISYPHLVSQEYKTKKRYTREVKKLAPWRCEDKIYNH